MQNNTNKDNSFNYIDKTVNNPKLKKLFIWFADNIYNNSSQQKKYFDDILFIIKKDSVQFVNWLQNSSELNNRDIQFWLGICLYCGEGIKQNFDTAFSCWNKAAKQGHKTAKIYLEDIDYANYKEIYRLASKGNPEYQYKLGIYFYTLFDTSILPKCNTYQYVSYWFECAAKSGYPKAICQVAIFYKYGIFVKQCCITAFKYFKQAAELDCVNAQYELGNCFYYGEGVTIDITKALVWWEKAAKLGNAKAKNALKELTT